MRPAILSSALIRYKWEMRKWGIVPVVVASAVLAACGSSPARSASNTTHPTTIGPTKAVPGGIGSSTLPPPIVTKVTGVYHQSCDAFVSSLYALLGHSGTSVPGSADAGSPSVFSASANFLGQYRTASDDVFDNATGAASPTDLADELVSLPAKSKNVKGMLLAECNIGIVGATLQAAALVSSLGSIASSSIPGMGSGTLPAGKTTVTYHVGDAYRIEVTTKSASSSSAPSTESPTPEIIEAVKYKGRYYFTSDSVTIIPGL